MKWAISKTRTRKSRQRLRAEHRRRARRRFPAVEALLGMLLWASTLLLILPPPDAPPAPGAYAGVQRLPDRAVPGAVEAAAAAVSEQRPDTLSPDVPRGDVSGARRLYADYAWSIAQRALLLFLGLIACAGLLMILRPELLRDKTFLLMANLLAPLVLLVSRGLGFLLVTAGGFSPDLEPALLLMGLGPLLAAILCGPAGAMALGLWIGNAMALQQGGDYILLASGLLVSVVSVDMARGAHRRSRVFRAGVWIGLAQALGILFLMAVSHPVSPPNVSLPLTAFLNGLLCAFLALLLIPLFEFLFGYTTDITLLELSDMGHPLLRRLAMEAPGTYHHSLMLASLAEAAARVIGANGLLVRVCAYYHDIGKLTKPDFFTENPVPGDSPHDDLSPHMSTLVITSHVKEGVTLALQHKLPRVVIEGILEHHGSGLVSFFYHRAKQQTEQAEHRGAASDAVKEEDFRYSGPRPQSREMGILSLADAVEAASRSMEKPSASRIEHLVEDIVKGKFLDHQMDDCRLTLHELSQIKRSFTFSLTNMRHGRIPYPGHENSIVQPPAPSPAAPAEPAPAAERDA